MGYRYDEDTGFFIGTGDEEGGTYVRSDDEGGGFINIASDAYAQQQYKGPSYFNYDEALKNYSSGKVPWNYTSLYGDTGYGSTESQGGLSSREAFNLNALWGGTQFAQGRVTDFSHLDPSQIEANKIAGQTRDELWAIYDQLKAQGKAPEKNPDQMALDFYVNNVGPQGNQFGYGPGANTVLVTEALKNQFLNQPSVVAATGSTYQTPPETLQYAQQFGVARQAGVPTWQVFEQQGYSKDWLGSLMPMIIGGMVFPGLAAGLGGGALGAAGAGALIGGTTAEIGGGDFLKGALTGAIGGGLSSGLSGISSEIASALDVSQPVADAITKAAATAVRTGVSGGDIEQAIIGSLVNSGVSGVAGEYLPTDIAKAVVPIVSTALLGGDVENALIKSGLSYLGGVLNRPGETAADVEDRELGEAMRQAESQNLFAEAPTFTEDPIRLAQAGDTRIDVVGSPFYAGMEGSESVTGIPSGYRLATYDEANQMDAPATMLPDGTMAFIVPDNQVETVAQPSTEPTYADISDIFTLPQYTEPQIEPVQDVSIASPISTSPYEGLEGYTPEIIQQLYDGTYAGPEAPASDTETLLREILGDETVNQLYPAGVPTSSEIAPVTTSPYEGLEGYTPEVIKQLEQGAYAGSEQTEAEVKEQLGDLYDVAYPEGIPTSSSPYEGLGYDANLINQLMEGPSATLNEDGTYTYGGYSGPEQTEAEVREQMGDLYDVAYPGWTSGYDLPSGGTIGGSGSTTGTTSGGTAGGGTGTTAAGGVNYGALGQKIQNIFNTQEPNYPSPIKPYLSPNMLVGQIDRSAQQAPDYAQIIGALANIGGRKMKDGGSTHIPGPEGKLYERHYERGFAVGGPGTGQSDDIPTMLSDGEYVIDADTVAALGDGSSKAGAELLDKFRQEIRSHKRSAPTDRIPPKAKNPLAYLKAAKKAKG